MPNPIMRFISTSDIVTFETTVAQIVRKLAPFLAILLRALSKALQESNPKCTATMRKSAGPTDVG